MQKFEIRFPFKPSKGFGDATNPLVIHMESKYVSLIWNAPYAVINVGPFDSEEDAKALLPALWVSLGWASIERLMSFTVEMDWGEIKKSDDPLATAQRLSKLFGFENSGPINGLADGSKPLVLPIGPSYRFLTLSGDATVSQTMEGFMEPFLKALSNPVANQVYADEKLRTAIQLLTDSYHENSVRSQFLTCMTALEVLSQPLWRHPLVVSSLEEFAKHLDDQIAACLEDGEARNALESLKKEIVFKRETSIRRRIRSLVYELPNSPTEDLENRAKKAVDVYDKRGILVHTGSLDDETLTKCLRIARDLLTAVVKARMQI